MCYYIIPLLGVSVALNIFYLFILRPAANKQLGELRERIRKTIEKMDENHQRSATMLKTYRDVIDQLSRFIERITPSDKNTSK